jgi:hypothetical protein|tara:strand:- start:21148 stop:21330 length:183 start_codon:yes stop_codon:yes gene_type:complete
MVEPVDDRGLTPLTRIRPIKRDDKPRKQVLPTPEEDDDATPVAKSAPRKKRLGGNIDERC